jgi:hypothetical protein
MPSKLFHHGNRIYKNKWLKNQYDIWLHTSEIKHARTWKRTSLHTGVRRNEAFFLRPWWPSTGHLCASLNTNNLRTHIRVAILQKKTERLFASYYPSILMIILVKLALKVMRSLNSLKRHGIFIILSNTDFCLRFWETNIYLLPASGLKIYVTDLQNETAHELLLQFMYLPFKMDYFVRVNFLFQWLCFSYCLKLY